MVVRCPNCGSTGKLNADAIGHSVRCPKCGSRFVAGEQVAPPPAGVKWYYAEERQKFGPLAQSEFEQLTAAGTIKPDTLVWHKGLPGWLSWAEVQGGEQSRSGAASLEQISPAGLGDAASATVWPGTVRKLAYGGGFRRAWAKVIDLIFLLTIASLVQGLSNKLFPEAYASPGISPVYAATVITYMLLWVFYLTWFVGRYGATPGKMVFNLKVVTPDGGKVGYGLAFARCCGEFIVICLTLLLGYLPVFFDSQKRGVHDRLCGTRVIVV